MHSSKDAFEKKVTLNSLLKKKTDLSELEILRQMLVDYEVVFANINPQ